MKVTRLLIFPLLLLALSVSVHAQDSGNESLATNPGILTIVVAFLIAAPFVLLMLTSYVKIAVVLSILRNAFGRAEIPPKHVITGIALVMTIFIMAPVAEKMYSVADGFDESGDVFSEASVKSVFIAVTESREPLRSFLSANTSENNKTAFLDLSKRLSEKNGVETVVEKEDFRILIPGFLTSQLTAAFKLGFLLFLPFLVIDLVVGSILQAMGMQSLPQAAVAIPFKLLLFLMIDGWGLLFQNLVLGFS